MPDDVDRFDSPKILRGVRLILEGLGVDLKDPNFKDTPDRVLRSYHELFEGLGGDLSLRIDRIFSTSFPSEYSGIVIVDNIRVFGVCPHHLLPVEYSVDVGYISQERMLGISKLPRLVQLLARRPVLQETMTQDIATHLKNRLKASGVMVVARGKHMCMRMRGIEKPDADTTTSAVYGTFENDVAARQEFLSLVSRGR